MSSETVIAVMGGTRFDTETGCDVVRALGGHCVPSPAMGTPSEQNSLQYTAPAQLQRAVEKRCGELASKGVGALLVFCNSLSVSIDADRLALCSGLRVVTPLTALPAMAGRYEHFFVLGANAKSVAGIENILYGLKPGVRISSYSSLELVECIEDGMDGESLWEKGLGQVVELALAQRAQCFVLGCTHYSAMAEFIEKKIGGRGGMAVADTGRMAARILLNKTRD